MNTQYNVLSLVLVDRGMIQTGTIANGQPVMGKHIPYYAGLIIQNQKTNELEFLDDYNSEILLREFFGYQFNKPSLKQIVAENIEFLNSNLSTITVTDLDTYRKVNKIKKATRNSARMKLMGERMRG